MRPRLFKPALKKSRDNAFKDRVVLARRENLEVWWQASQWGSTSSAPSMLSLADTSLGTRQILHEGGKLGNDILATHRQAMASFLRVKEEDIANFVRIGQTAVWGPLG